eukprot:NODE_27013_length_529_cov_1.726368.p3 GENE.NODE_27013_length_529_cov_1.726368~~NODE_27013_length_529_cov_1.726368.p3  ORF type:complete len:55 (+),score=11.45 NODE_27013_length_529_cov_1.726368:103-267(+)
MCFLFASGSDSVSSLVHRSFVFPLHLLVVLPQVLAGGLMVLLSSMPVLSLALHL